MLSAAGRAAPLEVNGSHKTEELIGKLPIFSRLATKQVRKLARLTSHRRYSKADMIINKGDMGLGLFAIVSGKAEVFDLRDGANVPLGTVQAGDCVGEMALIDEQPRSANVRVLEDTECLILTREDFNRLVKRDPEILWGIVPVIVQRLRQVNARVAELSATLDAAQSRSGATSDPVVPAATTNPLSTLAPPQEPGTEHEAVNEDQKAGIISPFLQLSSATLLFGSSLLLFGTQQAVRLVVGDGSLSRRVGDSNAAVNSLAKRVEDNMSGSTQRVLNSFRGLLKSIDSVLDR